MSRLRAWAGRLADDEAHLVAVLRLSLVLVVVNSGGRVGLLLAVATVTVVALPRPGLLGDARLWWALAAVVNARNVYDWHLVDNHVVITGYWCLAVALALSGRQRPRVLATNGRLLIGLAFALAVAWKLASGEYVGGEFFHYTLLGDERFRAFAELGGGLAPATYDANQAAVATLPGATDAVALASTGRVRLLAGVLTWWTLAIEAAVALAFLAPGRRLAPRARDLTLLVFFVTTYLLVPVGGFAGALAVLGLAQAPPRPWLRLAYVALLPALLVWAPVWQILAGG